MEILLIIVAVIVLLFGFVVLFGAPYVPTLKKQTAEAIQLLELKPGDRVLELGSGDGRVLKQFAKRGIYSTGFELNPLLVLWSKIYLWPDRKLAKVHLANFWRSEWPVTEAVYVFLLPKYMNKLDKKVIQYKHKPVKLVSYAFEIKDKKSTKKLGPLFRYDYK